jgi:hypothetical protein
MADRLDLSELSKLAPEARLRVEEALKRTLDAELSKAATGVTGPEAMAHSRSKGFFFSRSKTTDVLRGSQVELDRALLRNVETMNEAEFSKFAERLVTLRKARSE